MALWGKTDTVAAAPKWVARKATFNSASATVVNATDNNINLIPSNTGFNTGDEVNYSIAGGTVIGGLVDATTYYTRVVAAGVVELYDTYAHAIVAEPTKTGRLDISGLGVGSQTLQRTGASNAFGDHNWNGTALVFVDAGEAKVTATRAKGIKNAGWWLYRTWTNEDTSVAQYAECLVAMQGADVDLVPGTTGDREDTIAVDAVITVATQPANFSTVELIPVASAFTVVASIPAGVLNYQWQYLDGVTWTNFITELVGWQTTTTATLGWNDSTVSVGSNGMQVRCQLTATGYATVNSATAVLTVTEV